MEQREQMLQWIESTFIPQLVTDGYLTVDGVSNPAEISIKSAKVNFLTVTGFALTTPIKAEVNLCADIKEKQYNLVIKVKYLLSTNRTSSFN